MIASRLTSLRSGFVAALMILAGGASAGPANLTGGDCFVRQDSRDLAYRVVQVGAPPPFSIPSGDYAPSSPVYPATDYVTGAMARVATPSPPSPSGLRFRKYFLLWANRCNRLGNETIPAQACLNAHAKGNGYPGMLDDGQGGKVRAVFTSYAGADACTLMQARRVLGQDRDLSETARRARLRLWDRSDATTPRPPIQVLRDSAGAAVSDLVDVCVLEARPEAGDATGIALDYEVSDGRTPQQTMQLVEALADIVHARGKSLLITTNPLPGRANGLTGESLKTVLDHVDTFIPAVSTGASLANSAIGYPMHSRQRTPEQAMREQVGALESGTDGALRDELRRKIVWNVGLYDVTLPEAAGLRAEILKAGYGGVLISRSFLKEGGSCTRAENQLIACLAKGVCDGRFGLDR